MPLQARIWQTLLLTITLILFACTSADKTGSTPNTGEMTPTALDPAQRYQALIESHSDGETQYSGFYNNFEYKATLLNMTVRNALLDRQSEYFQWDREKRQTEQDRSSKEAGLETTVFLSFFTPERKNDNVSDSKTIWRLYLDAGGHRYQGKAKKIRLLFAELEALYPYHTRWNTSYLVSFPIPTSAIETQDSTLTITGPLGTKSVRFRSIR